MPKQKQSKQGKVSRMPSKMPVSKEMLDVMPSYAAKMIKQMHRKAK